MFLSLFSSLASSSTVPKGQKIPIKRSMASPQHATAWAASAHIPTMTFGWRPLTPSVRAPPARWWRPAQPSKPPLRLLDRSALDWRNAVLVLYEQQVDFMLSCNLKSNLSLFLLKQLHRRLGCYTV